MIYATISDMMTRFGETELAQLTDLATPPEAVDVEIVETALADASALVDTYLGKRYVLPMTGCADPDGGDAIPPTVLTRAVCDIARYNLYHDITPEHDAYRRRQDVVKLLEAIALGTVMLGCPLGDAPAQELVGAGGSGATQHGFSPRGVDDAHLTGFA